MAWFAVLGLLALTEATPVDIKGLPPGSPSPLDAEARLKSVQASELWDWK